MHAPETNIALESVSWYINKPNIAANIASKGSNVLASDAGNFLKPM